MCVYNADSQEQDSRRFNSIVKTKYIDDLGIVYLWVSHRQSCSVIKAFGGLVIFRAIAGSITSYSREIYALLKSLL